MKGKRSYGKSKPKAVVGDQSGKMADQRSKRERRDGSKSSRDKRLAKAKL